MGKERSIIKQQDGGVEDKNDHQEAIDLFEQNRDFYEHYARGEVKVAPAPSELNTFAFDLENDTIYLNARFYKSRGLSDEKTSFATFHEIEHCLEKKRLLTERNGPKVFKKYIERIKADKAFSLMDNCVADIRENKTVIHKTNEEFGRLEQSLYKEDLFKEIDFTSQPRHIQFSQAFLRESRVLDEECTVAPEVRTKLDEVKAIRNKSGSGLMDVMTHPDTPMSMRLKLQDRYLWPVVEELKQKDLEDIKNKGSGKGSGQVGQGNEGQGVGESSESRSGEKGKKWFRKNKKASEEKKDAESGKEPEKPLDPNEVFKEAYERAAQRVPNAVPIEEIEKAFKKWEEGKGSSVERADKEYADKLGVKVEDLKRYRSIVESIQRIINPETSESVIEELRNLFNRIIARRLKPTLSPRYPTEEGEDLADPAGLVSGVKGGELEPKVWETQESIEKPGKKFGEVEITLVFDRSGSMAQGSKLSEQRKAAVMAMEALKEFGEQCEEERVNMTKPLEIRTEIFSFQATAQDGEPLKKMSRELGEKERIDISVVLSSAPGQNTTDFIPLETIEKSMSQEVMQKIKDGELKKIVIVFTDGESGGKARVKTVLEKLRGTGVVAIGIGITNDGKAALETYAPDARLAEKAEDLARVLSDLLKEHLADI